MAYGSMAPGLMQMQIPQMQDTSVGASGNALLKALLANRSGGAGGMPALGGANGGIASLLGGGMGNGLLSKLFPQQPAASGALDGMGGGALGAGVGDMGGAPMMGGGDITPTALTGLW